MIVCERCGSQNADGESFCGSCGAFLEWEGARSEPVAQTTPAPPPPVPGPVTQRTTVPPAPVSPAPAPQPPSVPVPEPSTSGKHAADSRPALPTDPAPATSGPDDTTAATEPERRGPQAVKPSEAIRRRPTTAPVADTEPPPAAGDLICGQCGAGNDPVRRFCRKCGASLVAAKVVTPLPWWRRLLARLRAFFGGRRYEAGYRRPVRQPVRIKGRLILLLVLGAIIAVAVFPGRSWLRAGSDLVRDRISDHVQVAPTGARASSAAAGNTGALLAIDGVGNQYWAPAGAGPGTGQWVEIDLPEAVRVLDLIVYSGVSADRKQFLAQARPREMTVTFTADDGKTTDKTIRLRDQPGKQQFSVRADRTVRVRFTLRSAYGVAPGRRVAVAELELFARA